MVVYVTVSVRSSEIRRSEVVDIYSLTSVMTAWQFRVARETGNTGNRLQTGV